MSFSSISAQPRIIYRTIYGMSIKHSSHAGPIKQLILYVLSSSTFNTLMVSCVFTLETVIPIDSTLCGLFFQNYVLII